MKKLFNKKGIVFAITLLFIGASAVQIINGDIVVKQVRNEKELNESKIQDLLNSISETSSLTNDEVIESSIKSEFITVTLESASYNLFIDDNQKTQIEMNGFGSHSKPGCPSLPSKTVLIGIPPKAEVTSLELINEHREYINGTYEIKPSPPISDGISPIKYEKNIEIYFSPNPYPSSIFKYLGMGQMRKYSFARVEFNPILYYPLQGKLEVIKNITLKIGYKVTNMIPEKHLDDTKIDHIASQIILNFDSIAPYYQGKSRSSSTRNSGNSYDFLIIYKTYQALQIANLFKAYEEDKGYNVEIESFTTAINKYSQNPTEHPSDRFRYYLQLEYQNNINFYYLLIIGQGDDNGIPMKKCYPNPDRNKDSNDPYPVLTDYYYADLSGNWDLDGDGSYGERGAVQPQGVGGDEGSGGIDFAPEIWVGRIPFNSFSFTGDNICDKTEFYENSAGNWKKNVLELGAILNFANENGNGWDKTDGAYLLKRCWDNLYDPNEYSHTRMFEQEGLSPSNLESDYALNRGNVKSIWPNGYGIVNTFQHGYTYFLSRKVWDNDDNGNGIPEDFEISKPHHLESVDCSDLNTNKPSIVFLNSCDNGYPGDLNNLAFELLRNGAVAAISSTHYGWYTVGWENVTDGGVATFDYYFFDYLIKSSYDCGRSLFSAKQYYFDNYDWGTWQTFENMYGFNLYGDPSLHASILPDLAVEEVEFLENPNVLEYCQIKAKVTNLGNIDVNNVQVSFVLQDHYTIETVDVGTLNAGQTKWIITSKNQWFVDVCDTQTILVIIDPANQIPERNELNNLKRKQTTIDRLFADTVVSTTGAGTSEWELYIGVMIDWYRIGPTQVTWEIVETGDSGVLSYYQVLHNWGTCPRCGGTLDFWDRYSNLNLNPGLYNLNINIYDVNTGYFETIKHQHIVKDYTGDISGTVQDGSGNPLNNAEIRLYKKSNDQCYIYQSSETSNSQGYYEFNNIKKGDYLLICGKTGYVNSYEYVSLTYDNQYYECNFILGGDTKEILIQKIEALYNNFEESIDKLLERMCKMSQEYASIHEDDVLFEIIDIIGSAISVAAGIKSTCLALEEAHKWTIISEASRSLWLTTKAGILNAEKIRQGVSAALSFFAAEASLISEEQADSYVRALFDETADEFLDMKDYALHQRFHDTIIQTKGDLVDYLDSHTFSPNFDYELVIYIIEQINDVLETKINVDDPDNKWSQNEKITFQFVNDKSFPGNIDSTQQYQFPPAYKAYKYIYQEAKKARDSANTWSIIKFIANCVIAAVCIAVGPIGWAVFAGMTAWSVGSTTADMLFDNWMTEMYDKLSHAILNCGTNYIFDVDTTLSTTDSIYSTLKSEISSPFYFAKDIPYSAEICDVKVNLIGITIGDNPDYKIGDIWHFNLQGSEYLQNFPWGDIIEEREATIKVTNTGSRPTDFTVYFYDDQVTNTFYRIYDLMPGAFHNKTITFTTQPALKTTLIPSALPDKLWRIIPLPKHETITCAVHVEVFAGLYPVAKKDFDEAYVLHRIPYYPQNQGEFSRDRDNNANNTQKVTEIINKNLSFDNNSYNNSFELNFTVSQNYSSVKFDILGSEEIEFFIYNETGSCVGYNESCADIICEFPAQYSKISNRLRTIYIPGATNRTYKINVTLMHPKLYNITEENGNITNITFAKNIYPVRIYATQNPFKSANLLISPPYIIKSLKSNSTTTTTLDIYETGEQEGLWNVTLTLSNLTNYIQNINGSYKYIGNITAGGYAPASLEINVPSDINDGIYNGTFVINTSYTEGEMGYITFIIDNEIPYVNPNLIIYEHGNAANFNDTIIFNVTATDNNSISEVVVDTSSISTQEMIWLKQINNTIFYEGEVIVDINCPKRYYKLPIFVKDSAGNINSTESILVKTADIHPTLYVGGSGPNNYTAIQDAIDNATMDDRIFVYNGTYNENLVINHRIGGLYGEDKNTTIINSSSNYAIWLLGYADDFCINAFTIINNDATGNAGILIQDCDKVMITNNIITGNCTLGIWLYNSNDNIIFENYISSLDYGGICLQNNSINNAIYGNIVHDIYLGIYTVNSSSNIIYHNNVHDNTYNAYDPNSNQWDNDYPVGGNYWDDYTGQDNYHGPNQNIPGGDGIGDIPYNIPGGSNQDRYPLMNNSPNPVADFQYFIDDLTVTFDASLSHVNYGDIVSYEWNFGDTTYGLGQIVIHTYSGYGSYNVTLTITETYGENDTISKTVSLFDTILPEISNIQSNPDFQAPGEWVNITCTVTDNVGIDEVKVNITYLSPAINASMNNINGTDIYYYNTTYAACGVYYYFIWVNDTNGNENISATYIFTIQEIIPIPPEIIDNTMSICYTGDVFTFNATVTDNIQVSTAWVEYWYGIGSHTNVSMSNVAGDYWEHTITIDDTLDTLHYIISANDTSNNWNNTGVKDVTISDNDNPTISGVQAIPPIQVEGGHVNISAIVIDNIEVDEVYLYIEYPDSIIENVNLKQSDRRSPALNRGTIENFSITQNKTGDTYYCNKTYHQPGIYTYHIWANDTSRNHNVSADYTFEITQNHPPNTPYDPNPADGATGVNIDADLSWTGGDPDPGDTVTYDVYFGTTNPPPKVIANQTETTYDPGTMNYNVKYYWKVIAWDRHEAFAEGPIWNFTTKEHEPDLDCDGDLSWTEVEPGSTVTGSFTVENIGLSGTMLDWKIESYPDWGTWTFDPNEGENLTPEYGPFTVQVIVVAPDQQSQWFSGNITIVNKEDSGDTCTIDVFLATPVSHPSNNSFVLQFLQRLTQPYPGLEQILLSGLFYKILNLQ